MTVCPGCATTAEAFAALDAGAQALKFSHHRRLVEGLHQRAESGTSAGCSAICRRRRDAENGTNGLKPAVWARDWVAISRRAIVGTRAASCGIINAYRGSEENNSITVPFTSTLDVPENRNG